MGQMTRLDRWETLLIDALQKRLQSPFEWSVNDCATFAFDVRRAITGEDAAAAWRGRYSDLTAGLRLMRRLGWADYEAMATALLGTALPGVLHAQRGDIVLGPDLSGFAVVTGRTVVGMSPDGPTSLALRDCARAWRV